MIIISQFTTKSPLKDPLVPVHLDPLHLPPCPPLSPVTSWPMAAVSCRTHCAGSPGTPYPTSCTRALGTDTPALPRSPEAHSTRQAATGLHSDHVPALVPCPYPVGALVHDPCPDRGPCDSPSTTTSQVSMTHRGSGQHGCTPSNACGPHI